MSKLSTLIACAIAAIVVASAGAASARTTLVNVKPTLTTKIAAPKISVPKICKNSISRTFTVNGISYTAKKCR
jgi:hypothetical protein